MQEGISHIELPNALDRKFPNAGEQFRWRFVFSSGNLSRCPRTGKRGRHHIPPRNVHKALSKAVQQSGIDKYITCHSLRHIFVIHLLEAGYDIRTVQELLGHSNVQTTMIYTHVLTRGGRGVISPADRLIGGQDEVMEVPIPAYRIGTSLHPPQSAPEAINLAK